MLNFHLYEMPLKYVTSIQVTRIVDTEMDFEIFVQYHRRLTDSNASRQKPAEGRFLEGKLGL